jgi:hypothetical protein
MTLPAEASLGDRRDNQQRRHRVLNSLLRIRNSLLGIKFGSKIPCKIA